MKHADRVVLLENAGMFAGAYGVNKLLNLRGSSALVNEASMGNIEEGSDLASMKNVKQKGTVNWSGKSGGSAKGLIGKDFENYLTKEIGGDGSFCKGGRDFDGGFGNKWWEAKSGKYWERVESTPKELLKFKSDMGDRLKIATNNGATYEIYSNTPIPNNIKEWLIKKGISSTEVLK